MASVGSVYSKAVYELAVQSNEQDAVLSQLKALWEACASHPQLHEVLTGPVVDASVRVAVLGDVAKALGLSGLTRRLAELLAARGRLQALPEVIADLTKLIESSQGVHSGVVRAAVELTADELNVLGSALAKRVGGKVKLSQQVDPSLLGGVVATVAGRTFDASLRTQIERFKNELI
jgi:F-type H+-transporting ATPase subunit delta